MYCIVHTVKYGSIHGLYIVFGYFSINSLRQWSLSLFMFLCAFLKGMLNVYSDKTLKSIKIRNNMQLKLQGF